MSTFLSDFTQLESTCQNGFQNQDLLLSPTCMDGHQFTERTATDIIPENFIQNFEPVSVTTIEKTLPEFDSADLYNINCEENANPSCSQNHYQGIAEEITDIVPENSIQNFESSRMITTEKTLPEFDSTDLEYSQESPKPSCSEKNYQRNIFPESFIQNFEPILATTKEKTLSEFDLANLDNINCEENPNSSCSQIYAAHHNQCVTKETAHLRPQNKKNNNAYRL